MNPPATLTPSVLCVPCAPGGTWSGLPTLRPQFPGEGGDHALRDPCGASPAVCVSHHLLPEKHPSPGAQVHPQGRVHSGTRCGLGTGGGGWCGYRCEIH